VARAAAAQPGNWRFVTAKLPSTVVVLALPRSPSGRSTCRWRRSARASASCPRAADAGAAELRLGHGAEPLRPDRAIALLGAIESLLCARVADGLIGDRHDPNQELMAQGMANFAAPLFGGIAVTGTIARTMTNVKSGARSPVAGIVHALRSSLVIVALAPSRLHPARALAAVLLWVAFNMVAWRELRELRSFSMFYRAILLTTLALTVVFDLTVAVEVGSCSRASSSSTASRPHPRRADRSPSKKAPPRTPAASAHGRFSARSCSAR
jgi:SulP family sulfate permease